jgi:signal transduction histidine kinase
MEKQERKGLDKLLQRKGTDRLNRFAESEQDTPEDYVLIPFPDTPTKQPVWRIRFDVLSVAPVQSIRLAINGDIVLGAAKTQVNAIDLEPYNARELGVSRRHLMLRPTDTDLFALDLNSTNGTRRNGQPISSNTPQAIRNGDVLSLGNLQLAVNVIEGPGEWVARFTDEQDMASALVHLSTAITSQLKLDDVLDRILEMTINFTHSDAAALWLIDEKTGDLTLRAERGIGDRTAKLMKIPAEGDYHVVRVVQTRANLRTSRQAAGASIKIKTDYLVEAAVLIPLVIGDISIGVLASIHRKEGRDFSVQDEQRLSTIGKFAVIAIQNSREYEATNRTLAKRVDELAAINGISQLLSAALDMNGVYDALRNHIRKRWEVENIGLWLFNEGKKKLEPFPKPTFHRSYDIGEGIIGKAAQTMEPQLGKDVEIHSGVPDGSAEQKDTTLQLIAHSTACIPLIMKNKVIGVLAVFSKTPGCFGEEDLKLLQAFAHPAAAAVQNAQLFSYIEAQWATVLATVNMLPHPLMIVNQQGELVVSNKAAETLLKEVRDQAQQAGDPHVQSKPLLQLLEGLSESRWRTREITVGDRVYVTTVEDASWVGTIILMQDVTKVSSADRPRVEMSELVLSEICALHDSIKGFAQQLQDSNLSQNKIKEVVASLLQTSVRAAAASHHLFDVAVRAKAVEIDLQPCSIKATLERALHDMQGAALAKSIRLDFRVAGNPFDIQGDRARLYRSFMKLIDNAIDISPEKSAILIELLYKPEEISLSIADAGPGYSPEARRQLFSRDYVPTPKRRQTGSSGQNMAAVKAAVAAHGGNIEVEDGAKGGSVFMIRFPKT